MSKYELPELPSDDELGITDGDREQLTEELPVDRPELGEQEMAALLGETFPGGEEQAPKARKRARDGRSARAEALGAGGLRSRWRGPVTLAILVALAAFTSVRTGLPRPVPASASDTVFSSARAMSILTEIARRPHPTGSPEHARVRAYLVERLRVLGLEPQVQTATSVLQRNGTVRAATVRNIVARLPGESRTGALLITAHYDSRELSPGGGDDGAGVVAILEALRALGAAGRPRNDVIVLLTDAEELGLLGARAFADQHPWMRDVSLVLSFDMRGGAGPSIMFETNDQNGWVVRALEHFEPLPLANSLAFDIYRRMPNDTDFTPFKEAGKQGLNFAAVGNAHVYHQALDTPENLSEATLQHLGLGALTALRQFGEADLRTVDAPNVVYFTVPLLGLVVYDARWVLPISGGLILLAVVVLMVAIRGGARPGGILLALGLAILGGTLSYGLAQGLSRWVVRFHPEAGSLSGSLYHNEGWHVLSLAAAVFGVVTALHTAARRWLSAVELSLGSVAVPLLLAVWIGFAAPLGAMDVQWPVAAALLAVLVLSLLGSRAGGVVGWIASLLLVVPVLAILVPLVELLWLALTFRMLALVAVGMAVTLHLCLAPVDSLRHPNGWWAPLTGLAVGAAALGMSVLTARPGASRPAPSTLLYVYEHGTGAAFWATDPSTDPVLDRVARAWAADRAGAAFSERRDLHDFGLEWDQAPVAPAAVVDAARPEVALLRDSVDETRRHVILGVRSRIGAERLVFERDSVGRSRFLSVDGVAVARPGATQRIEHWGVPDSMVVLEVDMPPDEPIGVHIVENLLRPEELLGAEAFRRPAGLAPDVEARSDRALFRFSVAAFADPRHAFMPPAMSGRDVLSPPGDTLP